ncbi:MAG: hypothetical protein M3P91_12165 [Actinomycetota bacterium]|nr:hypothetical protein [Actinomycetota bacterium]
MTATTPRARWVSAAASALIIPLLTAAPAMAINDGEEPDRGINAMQTVLIYFAAPVALLLLIAAFAVLPGLTRRARYRPGGSWQHNPIWFAGPEHPEEALAAAGSVEIGKGSGVSAQW